MDPLILPSYMRNRKQMGEGHVSYSPRGKVYLVTFYRSYYYSKETLHIYKVFDNLKQPSTFIILLSHNNFKRKLGHVKLKEVK